MFLIIIIGLATGWSIGKFMRGSSFGLVGDLIVGIMGAFAGSLLFSMWGLLDTYGMIGSAVMSVLGAIVVLWVFRILL
ncbi:MAG: Transglycosylase-associated protein [Firmicutes bacterium]|nr:Transglycosylase-associated protein [Bacillota bacterium]